MSESEEITYDKCQVCGYEAPSTEFIKDKCPICGSEDVDDANFDPYKDDDDEESW
jgi:predicted Zn-ribbon and HTH transcriptional regulator